MRFVRPRPRATPRSWALCCTLAERDTDREGEPDERPVPSFDGGARRTPPRRLTECEVYAAVLRGERPWPPVDPHAGPPNPVV